MGIFKNSRMKNIKILLLIFINILTGFNSETNETGLKVFTRKELAEFNGKNDAKPIYFALLGDVFDVTKSADFYGKNGDYSVFAGNDITRAVALWTKDKKEIDRGMDLRGLQPDDIKNANDISDKFKKKYKIVGIMKYKKDAMDRDFINKEKENPEEFIKVKYPEYSM